MIRAALLYSVQRRRRPSPATLPSPSRDVAVRAADEDPLPAKPLSRQRKRPAPYPRVVPIHYFAYGSNMAPGKLVGYSSSCRYVGAARLANHRLAFTRRSIRTGTGVADIMEAPGMTVWGALYEFHEPDLDRIDVKEGRHIGAYDRTQVRVSTQDDRSFEAITYAVVDKAPHEIKPSREYLDGLIHGATECLLPEPYLRFLESLRDEWEDEPESDFRKTLLLRGTAKRSEARGMGLVKINPAVKKERSLGHYAAVVYCGRPALAEVCETEECSENCCELDQSIRHALGIPGRESFGAHVTLTRVTGRRGGRWPQLIRSHTLVLPVWPPSWADSEKQIAVLHEKTIATLGLAPGEVIRISALVSEDGAYRLTRISRRVRCGSAPTINRGGSQIEYPRIDELYLDRDAREELEIPERHPALVEPDIARLFSSRLLLYGVTLFLAMAALANPLGKLGLSDTESVIAAFGIAIAATVLLIFYDIRGRVRY